MPFGALANNDSSTLTGRNSCVAGWSSFSDRVDDGHSYVHCVVVDLRRGEIDRRMPPSVSFQGSLTFFPCSKLAVGAIDYFCQVSAT